MNYKKNLLKQLETDEHYQELLKIVPEDQQKLIQVQVEAFIDDFSGELMDALNEIAESPEATEEFAKELHKLKGNST